MPTVTATDADFATTVLASKVPVLVDFWGPACGPCLMMAPILEEIAEAYEGRLTIAKVDVSQNPQVAEAYRVNSIPTLNFYVDGELVKSLVGGRPKLVLVRESDEILASTESASA